MLFAAAAPFSTAVRTAATSPFTRTVTKPDPMFSYEHRMTSAALHITSRAYNAGTIPRVSINPNASSPWYFIVI